jgi:POT family proton-dependent oligopeptide transporter
MTKPGLINHPRGLYVLFFTEMWERFSYYGMRALLVLYLVSALEFTRDHALEIYATYTALVYLSPILGGYLADRCLGKRRAVLAGAIVMALGHFAMAFPALLYTALGLLIAGNGFFKPNISTMVGSLYGEHDNRRDAGFTVFYMGINLGGFLAPLVCGTLGEKVGWHYGFGAAGVGMLVGLWVFSRGGHSLGSAGLPHGRRPDETRLRPVDLRVVAITVILTVAAVGMTVLLWPLLAPVWNALTPLQTLAAGLVLIILTAAGVRIRQRRQSPRAREPLTRVDYQRITAMGIMAVFVIFFWMGFEQAGGTMNLFALNATDRQVQGWEIPASYFQSLNPLLILLLAPFFSIMWSRWDHSRLALSSVAKQGVGMIILGLGFALLAVADQRVASVGLVSPWWLVGVYFLLTTGELFLSPIGLSMVTRLAPAQLVSLMMGLWFTAIAIANYLAGTLEAILDKYDLPLYWFLVGSSVGAGALLLLLTPFIRRLMHGVR